jgi:hypothetical protein
MEMDFLDVARELLQDPSMLDSFQFYLFDGPHAMADQYGTPQQAHSFQIRSFRTPLFESRTMEYGLRVFEGTSPYP